MHKNTSKKGFTLVEIMIVVVIIGLLAAMAIPAFKKVREDSRHSAMDNDARQIGAAAQQYMLESGNTSVTLSYAPGTGVVGAPLDDYVKQIGKNYTFDDNTLDDTATFSITHNLGGTRTYTAEGQKQ
ncbi:prepilin-type N-terminal cleavage/methylation domain-containing protein [Pelagicoccus sp. SDUM812003]|uniref:type II secretion system protein n=1 Tax=Pelagicoccus sp. SDUM812003 TaxID=3041267 RepID=UPI00280E3F28|nr:prepilin-type N-terminal cleavage/methylation domain-containing protein [Pelagicoccus sp. SDUM812003]MDQ8203458.1 prepilin-type N-terminal cleavage/methylation domain-containing protein [Pelagicoccus sp. SDUM812003]